MTVYETIIDELAEHGKSEKDVLWVGVPVGYGDEYRYDTTDLKKIFGFEEKIFDDRSNVPALMAIVGGNWRLMYVNEENYDTGYRDFWWEYEDIPQLPTQIKETGSCEISFICGDYRDNECSVIGDGLSACAICEGCPHRDEIERKLSHEN